MSNITMLNYRVPAHNIGIKGGITNLDIFIIILIIADLFVQYFVIRHFCLAII